MKTLTYFTRLKVIQAFAFLLIPLVLMIVNGGLLESVSAYAYESPMVFANLLTLAGALFVYDGYVERERWYNIHIGLSLFGVVLFPNLDYPIIHYTFAGAFFLGSLFNMVYFSSKQERPLKMVIAFLVLLSMTGCFAFGFYSVFWMEWIGMIPISLHFALEALEKID